MAFSFLPRSESLICGVDRAVGMNEVLRRRLRAELLEVGLLNQCCLDLMEAMESEFSLSQDQQECFEQLSRFLQEGIGKLTALSERVAGGEIVVLA